MWFIGVEVEQETSAPPPRKNPGSAPDGTIRNDDFSAIQRCKHCCDIVSNGCNTVPTLERSVALKIVVGNRPV